MKNRTLKTMAAVVTGGLLLTAGVSALLTARASDQPLAKTKSMGLVIDDHPLARDARAGVSYANVVKRVMPSVVKVEVTTAAKETSVDMPGMLNDPFFRQFFGGGMPRDQVHGAGRLQRLAHASTQVSFVPPPCDEFTTSVPARNATRVRPPGSTQVSRPVTAKGRRSMWRAATPVSVSVGETDSFSVGWLM